MSTICFEPVAGASGDMILGALFDLGADPEKVTGELRSAGLSDFELCFERRQDAHHLAAGFCDVRTTHHHHNGNGHGHHHHEHRGLQDILNMIAGSTAPDRAKQRASAIFQRLGAAEAAVHGSSIEEVHFHEVGAVDSIVDVFGACIALDQLDVDRVLCSEFKVGKGTVTCAHGTIPVPAPATVKLLEGQKIVPLDIEAELTTPTGAAVLTTLSEGGWGGFQQRLLKCGVGHGKRELDEIPNILRAYLLADQAFIEAVEIIETDIDDDSPETTAALPEMLRKAGARDATLTGVQMKKGRMGTRLTVVVPAGDAPRFADLLFRHSSTIGVRVSSAKRFILPRQAASAETPWGIVRAKTIERPNGTEIVPEFDSARELADSADVPVRQVMAAARTWRPR